MRLQISTLIVSSLTVFFGWHSAAVAQSNSPSVAAALKLRPIQKNVNFATPTKSEISKCTIKVEKVNGKTGWVVRTASGQALRRFVDTNADGVVDLWCYYQNGLEVYRDIDSNFNRKADQYRWLNTAGGRWAIDSNEDGIIDRWKSISVEEVSQEVALALAVNDVKAFERLLLSKTELKSLSLGSKTQKLIESSLGNATTAFKKLAANRKLIRSNSKWTHFGATRPGVVPQGTDGSAKDIWVHENTIVMVETAGTNGQIYLGTLIKMDDTWRLVTGPRAITETNQLAGIFFRTPTPTAPQVPATTTHGFGKGSEKLLAELEKLEKTLASATTAKAAFHTKRSEILKKLADVAEDKNTRRQWLQQLSDAASAAAQSGDYPAGVAMLKQLVEDLQKKKDEESVIGYVKFRFLTAEYGTQVQAKDADFTKLQERWLKNLEKYVADFPKNEEAAEAMLQLAISQEFAGKEKEAISWYTKITDQFSKSTAANKATGAKLRLQSVGKTIPLRGKDIYGRSIDLTTYRGKTVLIHYWATWCEPCKADMKQLRQILAKNSSRGFTLIGVCLDTNRNDVAAFLKKERLPWAHIHESGGLEGSLANQLGILTLPTMILVDDKGRVLNRNIHVSEVEAELKKRLR